jgi:hypothetical protein
LENENPSSNTVSFAQLLEKPLVHSRVMKNLDPQLNVKLSLRMSLIRPRTCPWFSNMVTSTPEYSSSKALARPSGAGLIMSAIDLFVQA